MFLSADNKSRLRPRRVFITLNAQYKLPCEQAFIPQQNLPSQWVTAPGPPAASQGTPRSCPPGPQPDRAHSVPAGETSTGVRGICPWRLGSQGRQAGSSPGRGCPPVLTGSQPASEPTGNEEKTTRASWKSPPGSTPGCDSVGLASKLPSHPSARTQGAGLQELARPRCTKIRKFLSIINGVIDAIISCLKTWETELQPIRWGFKALLQ